MVFLELRSSLFEALWSKEGPFWDPLLRTRGPLGPSGAVRFDKKRFWRGFKNGTQNGSKKEPKMESFLLRRTSGSHIGGPKGTVAVLGRNRRNDTSVFGAIWEARGAHWRSILRAFVDNFRDRFSTTFWRAFLVVLEWAR